MADTPSVEQIWADPDFQGLSQDEKRKVLSSVDPDFAGLATGEQNQVLGVHAIQSGSGQTKLQKAAETITKLLNFVNDPTGNLGKARRELAGLPGNSMGFDEMQAQGDELFNRAGDATTDILGKTFPKAGPVPAALAGTAVSMANPLNWLGPKGAPGEMNYIARPAEVSPEVAATGVPFTRADLSKNSATASLEASVAKTPTGAGPIEKFRASQKAAIDDFISRLQGEQGTNQPALSTGMEAKDALNTEQAANRALKNQLYSKVPKDAPVPLTTFTKLYNDIANELPEQIKGIVKKHAQLDANPAQPGDVGEFKGNTKQIPQPGPDYQPSLTPNATKPEYNIGYEAAPGTPSQKSNAPTLDDVRMLRSKLGMVAKKGGLDGFNAARLRDALTGDINDLAKSGGPLEQLLGTQAKDSLSAATNFAREHYQLRDHPLVQRLLNTEKMSDIPDMVFGRGRAEDVGVARAALGDIGFKAAQKAYFTDLLHTKDIGKALDKLDPGFLDAALTGKQLQALKLLDKIKKMALTAEKITPMQGSSRANAIWGLLGASGAELATGHPIAAAVTAVGGLAIPRAVAEAYLASTKGLGPFRPSVVARTVYPAVAAQRPIDKLKAYIRNQRQSPG